MRNYIHGETTKEGLRSEIYQQNLLIPADLSLEIDGIEGILPGDIIHSAYMPVKYNHSVKLEGVDLGPSTFFKYLV